MGRWYIGRYRSGLDHNTRVEQMTKEVWFELMLASPYE